MPVVNINLGQRTYPVIIGPNVLRRFGWKQLGLVRGGRLFVLYDAQVYALHAARIESQLKSSPHPMVEMVVPMGERSKSPTVLDKIYAFLFDEGLSRSDFILACGGGVTSDLVGYAAATALRGVRWGIVSTTLLGMVDAAIGGKTGINHPRGKNLIGSFWQPAFVLCDTSFLKTLPVRQLIAGLGEVTKYGGLIGGKMLALIDKYFVQNDIYHEKLLSELIYFSASYKANIVVKDERESGLRMLLNLGHTFSHAIENAAGYGKLLHGEAVILGLLAAVEMSCRLKPQRTKHLADYGRIINQMICLIPYRKINYEKTLTAMQLDKKRAGTVHRFVLLDKPGHPFIADNINLRLVALSLESALKAYKSEGGRCVPNPDR